MMKIIFAGTPEFAVPALESLVQSRHQVIAVYTQPDRPAGRGRKIQHSAVKSCALNHQIPIYQPQTLNSDEFERISELKADLMVVAAYGLILPVSILQAPLKGCINIHASLLPRWRGAAPIQRAILAGDEESGITIMQMDKGLDTGDILARAVMPISSQWTSADLHDELKQLGARLMLDTIDRLESDLTRALKQDSGNAIYAAQLSKQEARIDWNKPADVLLREIRAFIPWPVSFALFEDKPVRIWQARQAASELQGMPGEIVRHDRNGIFVSCQDSVLQITELQFAGKNRLSALQAFNGKNLSGKYFA